ncbi:hypothetical protein [Leptospira levettii]|uniref:Uncharacterized protein n=1 Tax=Leptospira levettii TaxID=2023178 RepID=A0AAW5VDI1_9LEPT|nr:hypothetical protein [Leptospira levettii]MCW7512118.1 hypothetical protein [Leptospira levettii]MCW7517143.1 hypothetical protein [Leptospira levettii]
MEIIIKNKGGDLKIVINRIDAEYRSIEYFLKLDQNIDWEKVFALLYESPRNNLNSFWVKGYEEKFGIMRFNEGDSLFSGLKDLSICIKNLTGTISEEFEDEYFQTYLDSFIHRMIYLDEIIGSII